MNILKIIELIKMNCLLMKINNLIKNFKIKKIKVRLNNEKYYFMGFLKIKNKK